MNKMKQTLWAMWLAMAMMVLPSLAYAQTLPDMPEAQYENEDYVFEGSDGKRYIKLEHLMTEKPQLYDMHTSMQMSYWGNVVDGLLEKISNQIDDVATLDDAAEMWDKFNEKGISLSEEEAQIMCLFVQEEDQQPDEEDVPNWPEDGWPTCGGVLDAILGGMPNAEPGSGFPKYIVNEFSTKPEKEAKERGRIAWYVLSSIGINAKHIEKTILKAAGDDEGAHTGITEGSDAIAAKECYTPDNSIRAYNVGGCGVFCTVTKIIMGLLNAASTAIVEATADNPKFQSAVMAALMLYVSIYGAMVVLGIANVALGDALMRMAKLGVVAMMIASETVMNLFHIIRCFFIEGTTYLIHAVMQAGLEAVVHLGAGGEVAVNSEYIAPISNGYDLCGTSFGDDNGATGPLVILEALLTQVISLHMLMVVITLALSSIYGFILTLFLIFGLVGFMMALLKAVTIYLTALIAQYLLLSLLPIFITFLLFDKTKELFRGWLNQLITYSLTPIFLFAYISLFVVVISAALAQILDVTICWDKWFAIAWVFDVKKPFFHSHDGTAVLSIAPFGFFEVLIFVLLVFLMKEFEDSVEGLASDIGDARVYANDAANQLKGWFKGQAKALKSRPVKSSKVAADKGGKMMRGGVGGHPTQSASGQRGVGGVAGAKQAISKAAESITRKGPGG